MIEAFFKGMREFRKGFTTYYDDDKHADAYDRGRDLAHRITLRRYEY